jgi:hypothetical protein
MTVTYRHDFETRWNGVLEQQSPIVRPILLVALIALPLTVISIFHLFPGAERFALHAVVASAGAIVFVLASAWAGATFLQLQRIQTTRTVITATLSEDGFETSADGATIHVPWSEVVYVKERRHNLFFHFRQHWNFIPASALASREEFQRLAIFAQRCRASAFPTQAIAGPTRAARPPDSPYAPPREDATRASALLLAEPPPRMEDVLARVFVPAGLQARLRRPLTALGMRPLRSLTLLAYPVSNLDVFGVSASWRFVLFVSLLVSMRWDSPFLPFTNTLVPGSGRLRMLARAPVLFDAREQELCYWSPQEQGTFAWSGCVRVTDRGTAFELIVGRARPWFLPKELFAQPQEVEVIRALFRRQLGSRAQV